MLAFLSADLTGALLERRLQLPPARPTALSAASPSEPRPFPVQQLRDVLRRPEPAHPGSPEEMPTATASPSERPGPSEKVRKSGAEPQLLGTMEGRGGALALLQQGAETRVLAPGEEWSGWTIIEVNTYSARLRSAEGKEVELRLALGAAAQPAVEQPAADPEGENPQPLTSRGELLALMKSTADWLPDVHVKPVTQNDAPYGVRLTFSKATNPFARLGLRSGDIVLSFNGHPLHGMEDLSRAQMGLRNDPSLNFEIDRNGEHVGLQVELDD